MVGSGLIWSDTFFLVLGDCLAGFVSYCDEEVIECVGYILGICILFLFIVYKGGRGSGLAFGGDD